MLSVNRFLVHIFPLMAMLLVTPVAADSWRSLIRESSETLRTLSEDNSERADQLSKVEELLTAAEIAAKDAGKESLRQAEPYLKYNRGVLELKKQELDTAKQKFRDVYDDENLNIFYDARYNIGSVLLSEASAGHKNTASEVEDFLSQLIDHPEPAVHDILNRFPAPVYQGPHLKANNSSVGTIAAPQSQGKIVSSFPNAGSAPVGGEEAAPDLSAIASQLAESLSMPIKKYQEAESELKGLLKANSVDEEARWNYELTLKGEQAADELQELLTQLASALTPPEQQQQQEEQQEQDQEEQQDGDSQESQNDEGPQGEENQDQQQQQEPQESEDQTNEEQTGEEQQRQQEDQQGDMNEDEQNQEEGDQNQMPEDPSETQQGEEQEPEMNEDETGEGEEQKEGDEQFDQGPDRGQSEEEKDPIELDPDAKPNSAKEAGEDDQQPEAAEPIEAEQSIFGMTPQDARLILETVNGEESKEGRRNFLRLFRKGNRQDADKAW
jgi:hypothetical protein